MSFLQKTNCRTKIFGIFILCFGIFSFLQAETAYQTDAQTRIRVFDLHLGNDDMVEFLRASDRIISRYLRTGRNRKSCEIRLRNAFPNWRMTREDLPDGRIVLSFAPDAKLLDLDPVMLRRYAKAMLEARIGRNSAHLEQASRFVGAALAGIWRHRRSSGKLMQASVRANYLKSLLLDDIPIDFIGTLLDTPELPPGPAQLALDETAFLLLEACFRMTGASDNALWDYFALTAAGRGSKQERFEATLGRALEEKIKQIPELRTLKGDDKERINALFRHYARSRLITRFSPRPPEKTWNAIRQLGTITVPARKAEKDSPGRPARKADISEIPELLKKKELPDSVLQQLCAELSLLQTGADPLMEPGVTRLLGQMEILRNAPGQIDAEQIKRTMQELGSLHKRAVAVEKLLDQSELEYIPPLERHKFHIDVVRNRVEPGGSVLRNLLDATEKSHMAE